MAIAVVFRSEGECSDRYAVVEGSEGLEVLVDIINIFPAPCRFQ